MSTGERLNKCTLFPAHCSQPQIQIHREQRGIGNSPREAWHWQIGYKEQRLFQRRKYRLQVIGGHTDVEAIIARTES